MFPSRALEDHPPAAKLLKSRLNLGQAERLVVVRLDAGLEQGNVRVERLEEAKRAREVVDYFEARRVGGAVAGRGERIDAGSVLVVFVGPEVGVAAAVGDLESVICSSWKF